MYSIQFSDWGLVLEFMGEIQPAEIRDWLGDVRQLTGGFVEPFSVIVDVQRAAPAGEDVETLLLEGLAALEPAGMERVALIVRAPDGVRWPRLRAVEGREVLRRFVAEEGSDWLVAAHAWVQRGIDPETNEMTRSV